MPAVLNTDALYEHVLATVSAQMADEDIEMRAPRPSDDCVSPAGHRFVASRVGGICRHCGRIGWR